MSAGRSLTAQHLIDSEVTHVLRRPVTSGGLDQHQGDTAFASFQLLIIRRRPVTHLLDRMWAPRRNLSDYDATYVALAESLDVPLLTTDRRLARASGLRCPVEVV
jgi:predicted nucleic acid-binding protein